MAAIALVPGKAAPPAGKAAAPPLPGKGAGKAALPPLPAKGGKGPPLPGKGGPPPPGGGKGAKARADSSGPDAFKGPKLKPLFWSTVADVASGTALADAVPLPFDEEAFSQRFLLQETRSLRRRNTPDEAAAGGPDKQRRRLRVLDDRWSQRLSIAFNRLPPPDVLANMVDTLDGFPGDVPSEAVIAMHAAMTEQREAVEQIVKLVQGDTSADQLDLPERYLMALHAVPGCETKLSCAAFIVGKASGLRELRLDFEKVGSCCQVIRRSKVIAKTVSTSLVMGNLLNRGTKRGNAVAMVLPESLLKLDECRVSAVQSSEDVGNPENRGASVLDFVAEAIVKDVGLDQANVPQQEVTDILAKIRLASSVSLEEDETSLKGIAKEVAALQANLTSLVAANPGSAPGVQTLLKKISRIAEETSFANRLLEAAKAEILRVKKWGYCKPQVTDSEFLSNWTAFLVQYKTAIERYVKAQRTALAELNRPLTPRGGTPRGGKPLTPRGFNLDKVSNADKVNRPNFAVHGA